MGKKRRRQNRRAKRQATGKANPETKRKQTWGEWVRETVADGVFTAPVRWVLKKLDAS